MKIYWTLHFILVFHYFIELPWSLEPLCFISMVTYEQSL